ncbi:MAG: energy-coupling factor ABC transporter ATP-binding protein [Oscillospiraceae bacterium]|jgi:energy-coupling factor transport system ATP-binding protein|nr:energy-coupling factor ABC transporter ATP-binding protein [Oscillospiraceae bacterium]
MSIRFEQLQFSYFKDGHDVIPGLTAEFHASNITVLTGVSGCGKSTLLYLAAGAYPHNAGILRSGKVTVDGIAPAELLPPERCRLAGMMFQNPELQFCMDTVKNELVFCLENIRTTPSEMEPRLNAALQFCGIAHLKNRTLLSLSGGERQKVMLACLVALQPKWLLLDEPFANIDDRSASEIAEKLGQLHQEKGVGILAVDHRLDNWVNVASTVRIMEKGRLLPETLSPKNLDFHHLEERGIIVPGGSYGVHRCSGIAQNKVLELRGLTLRHGTTQILRGITASFYRGRAYAIVGQSGCGKSSLFGALLGMYRYGGQALLDGKDLKKLRRKELGHIGFVTQNPQDQFVGGTVLEEILSSLHGKAGAAETAEKILKSIHLWRYRELSPYLLSQGQQRKLGVATLMAYDCRVLICDEPTYAQDRNSTLAIMDTLCRQVKDHHAALIFSTHDRQLALDFADEIWELEGGRLHAVTQSGL